jgi:4-amino-4-deoxy-L-arabinose transferase-like glycosyltransferase
MSLLVIALSCALAGLLGIPLLETIAAALLISSSPEFLANSDIIGVDVQMSLFCVLSATVGVFAVEKRYSRKLLALCGLVAGLAGATKYNAAPIALVPIFVVWYRDRPYNSSGRFSDRCTLFSPQL